MRTSLSPSVSRQPPALRRIGPICVLLALGTAAASILPQAAAARGDRHKVGSVVACSHYGRGCIRGPVREGRVELQVRMPGGTWIGCKGNCQRTLREEALDFFETLRDRVWDD